MHAAKVGNKRLLFMEVKETHPFCTVAVLVPTEILYLKCLPNSVV
jgi:hypothetical protein